MADRELTAPQWGILLAVMHAGVDGFNGAQRDPVLVALASRELIEWRGSPAKPRLLRWHATRQGWELVRDRERVRQIGIKRAIRASDARRSATR